MYTCFIKRAQKELEAEKYKNLAVERHDSEEIVRISMRWDDMRTGCTTTSSLFYIHVCMWHAFTLDKLPKACNSWVASWFELRVTIAQMQEVSVSITPVFLVRRYTHR